MRDYRNIIAKNLTDLRISAHLTQAEVAAKLSYSDKAVSKWERAESVPDIAVLKALSDMYGVTVDYLLAQHGPSEELPQKQGPRRMSHNQALITLISVFGVWFIAVAAFAVCFYFDMLVWQIFLWAVPVSSLVALVLTCVWGSRGLCFTFISIFLWSLASAVFFTFFDAKPWLLFVGAAILQVTVVLSFGIRLSPKDKNGHNNEEEKTGEKGDGEGEGA